MSRLEDEMAKQGEEIQTMKAPDDLERRLRERLDNQPQKTGKRWKSLGLIAASILFLFFFTYQFETMAYYGKKILGFDHVLDGTLSELNDQGKGQTIDKSVKLQNGAVVTLDGVMLDANQLIVFYTIEDESGNLEEDWSKYSISLDSFFGELRPRSGTGRINDAKTAISSVETFEAPNPLVKKLDFYITYEGEASHTGKISFELDRSRAMTYKYEQDIDQTIKTDVADYTFKSITASPTQTVIKGKVEVKNKEAWQAAGFPEQYEVELWVDGEKVSPQGSGFSTGLTGNTFDLEYDGLSHDIENLKLTMKKAAAEHTSNKPIQLDDKKANMIGDTPISVERVENETDKTVVTLNVPETFTVLEAELKDDNGHSAELSNAHGGELEKTEAGIVKQLKLTFDGPIDDNAALYMKKYVALEEVDDTIDIPVD